MSDIQTMVPTALDAMVNVLDLTPDDRVLVVTDQKTARIAEAFHAAASSHGCAVQTYTLPEAERPLTDVPAALSDMLPGHTVVLNLIQALGAEVPFRINWSLEIVATKRIRFGHAPGLTEAMMSGGPMQVDYAAMSDLATRLIRGFANAQSAHITTEAGTDLVVDIQGRRFLTDVKATVERGSNLPCGEIYCGPVETGANGVLVIDGTAAHLGQATAPVRLTLVGGAVQEVACTDKKLQAEVQKLLTVDAQAGVIGELGIGINPAARLVNNMLEDEKAFRTCHVAIGGNYDLDADALTHLDGLIREPTITVRYGSGRDRVLLEGGNLI